MLSKSVPVMASAKSDFDDKPRPGQEPLPREKQPQIEGGTAPTRDEFPEKPLRRTQHRAGAMCRCERVGEMAHASAGGAHSLCQELFFFCTVKKVGDLPGAGCIYVETVVQWESGFAFAKVYSAKSAMNAVDILRSRVVPFFQHRGDTITEVRTRKTSEYCGLIPMHPFETFLTTSHIRHLSMDDACHSCRNLCEQFYRLLLKKFFPPALRNSFQFSLAHLQGELDAFVEAYNAAQWKHEKEPTDQAHPPANFSVHP